MELIPLVDDLLHIQLYIVLSFFLVFYIVLMSTYNCVDYLIGLVIVKTVINEQFEHTDFP